MIYIDNMQLVNEIKKVMIDTNTKQVDIANSLNVNKQAITKLFNKKNLTCDDMKKLLDIMGYDLVIDFKKRNWSITPMYISNVDKYRAIIYIVFGFVHDLRCG